MRPSPYQTTGGRVASGLTAGAMTCGALSALLELATTFDKVESAGQLLQALFVVYGGGMAVGGLVLIFLAAPVWWVCHRLGWRSWRFAVPLAALLGGGAMVGLLLVLPEGSPQTELLTVFWVFAPFSALVGLVAWRVAYRKELERPEDVF